MKRSLALKAGKKERRAKFRQLREEVDGNSNRAIEAFENALFGCDGAP